VSGSVVFGTQAAGDTQQKANAGGEVQEFKKSGSRGPSAQKWMTWQEKIRKKLN